ncbi:extracellular matrix/biofilm biosynthesis regulator RemA family protein [Peribacillus frigoritolerans]|uniref:extracellular matrix regulator RemB n=1 Tax=Peribacillus frigoritolerans TaxID=450367 RepID=UPI003D2C9F74
MYLHIGEDILVKTDDVIAILDKKLLQASPIMSEFLEKKSDVTSHLAKNSVKSIVVTDKQIYYSPLASSTLKKRSLQPSLLIDDINIL